MRESIHKYFKVGTIQFMSYPNQNVLESIKKLLVMTTLMLLK